MNTNQPGTAQAVWMWRELQLPEGVILPEVQHKFDHKMPLELKIPLLNTNQREIFITKNMAIMTLQTTDKV